MIPPFEASRNLPPGVHTATWDEFVARYGSNPHRLALLAGLKAALDALRIAGCARAYLDGSFVTAKVVPGDFDGCWEVAGVDPDLLDPVLLVFANQRAAQKAKYGGEFFPAEAAADPVGTSFSISSSATNGQAIQKAVSPSASEDSHDYKRASVPHYEGGGGAFCPSHRP